GTRAHVQHAVADEHAERTRRDLGLRGPRRPRGERPVGIQANASMRPFWNCAPRMVRPAKASALWRMSLWVRLRFFLRYLDSGWPFGSSFCSPLLFTFFLLY